jgi:ATP-dependent Clp protease ATP-binding subunit ClpB
VILFDEIEKAHPDVWNVLLQVLDDGRLTDGQGRTVDFKNTVLILTSNIGSQHLLGTSTEESMRSAVMEELRKAFRPEFLNRLDEIVLFHRLDRSEVRRIVDIQLARFEKRLAKRELSLTVDEQVLDFLANVGFDPTYGARPLKRAMQQHLENPLAQEILSGAFAPGDMIAVHLKDGVVTFERRAGERANRQDRPNAPGGRA